MQHTEIIEKMRGVYDRIAAQFASEHSQMEPDVIAAAQRFLAVQRPNGTLLELGCGAGRDLAWFARQGIEMSGADLSYGMLDEARRLGAKRLAQMDMLRLGWAAHSFAAIWCNAALLHLPRADAPLAMAEMARVLKPGGLLFLSLQEGDSEGWETRPNRPERLFTRFQADELRGLLASAGFAILDLRAAEAYERRWLHVLGRFSN